MSAKFHLVQQFCRRLKCEKATTHDLEVTWPLSGWANINSLDHIVIWLQTRMIPYCPFLAYSWLSTHKLLEKIFWFNFTCIIYINEFTLTLYSSRIRLVSRWTRTCINAIYSITYITTVGSTFVLGWNNKTCNITNRL